MIQELTEILQQFIQLKISPSIESYYRYNIFQQPQMDKCYQLKIEKVLDQFKTSPTGLKEEAILLLQKEFGENALAETKIK